MYPHKNWYTLVSLHSQIDASEGKDIAGHFTDGATKAQESGILVNQIKYYFVRVDEQNGDKFRLIIGKKGATGVTIYKTEQGGYTLRKKVLLRTILYSQENPAIFRVL